MLNLFQHNALPPLVIPKQVRDDEICLWRFLVRFCRHAELVSAKRTAAYYPDMNSG
jgi:hypothetical protein